jgi:hypothetical protein
MEQTLTDSLGNTITLTYDAGTDVVKVKNSGVDTDFREVSREATWNPELVLQMQIVEGIDDGWDTYSDIETRDLIRQFWLDNKVNQD